MTMTLQSLDPDQPKVLEILRAASRGRWDPDVQLAAMLSELASRDATQDAKEILRRLAHDVGSDHR